MTEQSVTDARATFEGVFRTAALWGIEDLLVDKVALIIAMTQEWAAVAPLTTSQLGFTLRRYDATGAQDPEHGDWLIDVFEAE